MNKLSVIIICLNEERHLPRCLSALTREPKNGLDVELVVVDGGSTDRSRDIARQYGARVVDSPRGIPRQRNAGARAALGDVLAYVDADVEVQPGWFDSVARHFSDKSARVLGSAPRLPADASWVARAYALHWGLAPGGDEAAKERLLSTQSLVLGREVFERVGGFREDLAVDEDTCLVLHAKRLGYPIVYDEALAYVHHGEPRGLGEFFRRIKWGSNYAGWYAALRRGDFAEAWRPQYLYGAVVGGEVAALAGAVASGSWRVGVPVLAILLAATVGGPAWRAARRHRAFSSVLPLCAMYAAYGLASAAGMVGMGWNKARRWR